MNNHFKKTAIAALCSAVIGMSGCGSDSATTTSTITTTPSLGQISNATVTIYQADGSTVLGSGEIGADGAVSIDFSGYSGAVVIEVAGDADAQYFDEASGTLVSFPAGQNLHAIAPTASGSFAVSILTELAYQGAVSENLLPLDATEVNALNEKVRTALIPEISDLLTPPTLFNAGSTGGSLGSDDAGKYALKLAALAKLGDGEAAPALAVMQALVADLADGDIDGLDGAGASVSAPYSNFATEFGAAIVTMANGYGSSGLQTAAAGFAAPTLTIDFGTVSSGGGNNNGAGATLNCDTSLFQQGAPVTTPTANELIAFAGAYVGQEGTFDDSFNFTKTGDANFTLSVAGVVTYNGNEIATTSACVESISGGKKQLVLNFAKGHLDVADDHESIHGVSPADGATIIQPLTTNGGSSGSNSPGNTSATGVTLQSGNVVEGPIPFAANPYISGGKIGTATSGAATLTIYDYVTTLAVATGDTQMSTSLNTPLNSCALAESAVTQDNPACSTLGIDFNRSAGTLTFTSTPMKAVIFSCPGDCTISGTISFTPY